jgi:NADH dehydrogenase
MVEPVITVFGGSGFIGRYLVKRLAAKGARVRVAVRDPSAAGFLRPMGDVGQVAPIQANVGNEASVAAAVAGAGAVVNLVGILFERGRRSFTAVHVEGAGRVARAATAAGVARLVQVSAIGAGGDSPSAYARSKAAGEAAVREAFPGATIVRPSVVFGPEDDFFNRFAALARLMPALPLFDGGATRFQPVYVGDVAEAVSRLLDSPESTSRTYELGGPRVYTYREIMELVIAETRRERRLVSIPLALARPLAALMGLLPEPPLTRDQLLQLGRDNVVSDGALGLSDLGVAARAIEPVVATYLRRYRRAGHTESHRPA